MKKHQQDNREDINLKTLQHTDVGEICVVKGKYLYNIICLPEFLGVWENRKLAFLIGDSEGNPKKAMRVIRNQHPNGKTAWLSISQGDTIFSYKQENNKGIFSTIFMWSLFKAESCDNEGNITLKCIEKNKAGWQQDNVFIQSIEKAIKDDARPVHVKAWKSINISNWSINLKNGLIDVIDAVSLNELSNSLLEVVLTSKDFLGIYTIFTPTEEGILVEYIPSKIDYRTKIVEPDICNVRYQIMINKDNYEKTELTFLAKDIGTFQNIVKRIGVQQDDSYVILTTLR